MDRQTYNELYASSVAFRETAEILARAHWGEDDIVKHWYELQNDNEAGDDDVP